jgi:hypothetical protein
MEWLDLLYDILEVCVIPLLGVLTAYIVKFIKIKSDEITSKNKNELADKYIAMLTDTITSCVIATNQTYVETLKDKNAFSVEAQQEAFHKTYEAVINSLTEDAKAQLATITTDLTTYITEMIEAKVNEQKKEG